MYVIHTAHVRADVTDDERPTWLLLKSRVCLKATSDANWGMGLKFTWDEGRPRKPFVCLSELRMKLLSIPLCIRLGVLENPVSIWDFKECIDTGEHIISM